MRKLIAGVILLTMSITLFGCNKTNNSQVSKKSNTKVNQETSEKYDLSVTYLDVDFNNSQIIDVDGKIVLIDAGKDYSGKVIKYIQNNNIDTIDYVIATDYYNIEGIVDVLNNIEVKEVYIPGNYTEDEKEYRELLQENVTANTTIVEAVKGDKIKIGDAELEILEDQTDINKPTINTPTLISKLTYGSKSFLFIGKWTSDSLITNKNIECNVYKAVSSINNRADSELVKAVNPDIGIISAGTSHSIDKVKQGLDQQGADIYVTAECGNITVKSDGDNLKVETDN